MKNIIKYLCCSFLVSALLLSCEKDENKVFLQGGTAPVLSSSVAGPLVLNIANKNLPAVTFTWTNPNYNFTTGGSSQDVIYTLQMDTTGSNFTNPKKYEKVISKELANSFTVGELNSAILAMETLAEDVPHNMEFRIKSNLVNNSATLFSNVIKLVVTPYLDVLYPVPAKLFITGGATPGGWMSQGDPELPSQKFTKISSSSFEITITLNANGSYLFVPNYGDWNNKYGYINGGNANNVNGDDFKPSGNDIKAPPVTGLYKITVSFKTGKFTVVKI